MAWLANALADREVNELLTALDVSFCELDDAAAVSLGAGLKANTSLTAIDLCRNRIGGAGAGGGAPRPEGAPAGAATPSLGTAALAEALKVNPSLQQIGTGEIAGRNMMHTQTLGGALT